MQSTVDGADERRNQSDRLGHDVHCIVHRTGRRADAVITHGGHGTVSKALALGVPLVCVPLGRDQFDIAARVAYRGAGVTVKASRPPLAFGDALRRVLGDERYVWPDGSSYPFAALDTSRASQRWKFDLNGDGTARVYDSCPIPLYLTAPTTAGGQVSLQAVNLGAANQRRQVTQNSVGTYTLTNPATGFVPDGNATAGQAVTASATSTSQKWASVFTP